MDILSPVPRGSGAAIIHEVLSRSISGYRVKPYDPRLEFLSPLLVCKRERAGIVHAPPDHAALVASSKARLVLTFHNYILDSEMSSYSTWMQRVHYRTDLRWLTKAALRRADVVTAVSHSTRELVRRDLFAREIRVIPNGVDIDRFRPNWDEREGDAVNVLYCGNVTRRKGGHLISGVAERLSPNVTILIAAGLRGAHGTRWAPNVEWLGGVPYEKMPAVYQRADVLFHPAMREGLSLAVLEAMASGLPIVGSFVPSMAELVDEGKGGFLVSVDDVHGFADRINLLANEANLRRSMGAYNRAQTESFYRRDQMVQQYEDLFRALI